MELLWIPISVAAGFFQAVRTAAQKALNARLSAWMVTYVRSIYGLPVMLVYLMIVLSIEGRGGPDLSWSFLGFSFLAGTAQVIATYLLILLFQRANFAVGTMLTKTDLVQAALIGSVLFSEEISSLGWLAILLTVGGVLLISAGRSRGALARMPWSQSVRSPAVLLGLASGFGFCLSYLFLREATLAIETGSRVYAGAWAVVSVTAMQCVGVGIWLLATERAEFAKLGAVWRPSIFIGITSAFGSIGWFTAMALQNASYVKAVGQVEVIFTVLISTLYFRERISSYEYAGITTILGGVILFVL